MRCKCYAPEVKAVEIAHEGVICESGQANSGENLSNQSTWSGNGGWNVQ